MCKDTCNYDNWYTKLLTCYLSLVFYLHVHVQVYANLYKKIQLSCEVFYGRVLNALLAFLMEDYNAKLLYMYMLRAGYLNNYTVPTIL